MKSGRTYEFSSPLKVLYLRGWFSKNKLVAPPLAAAERKELEWESPEMRTLVTDVPLREVSEAGP